MKKKKKKGNVVYYKFNLTICLIENKDMNFLFLVFYLSSLSPVIKIFFSNIYKGGSIFLRLLGFFKQNYGEKLNTRWQIKKAFFSYQDRLKSCGNFVSMQHVISRENTSRIGN